MEPFETDGLTAIREQPWVVVLAETVAHVRSVLRICRECGVPLVTRGAGTGLSGGARPNSDGVLLVLTKMNKILEVDVANCTATVETGRHQSGDFEAGKNMDFTMPLTRHPKSPAA